LGLSCSISTMEFSVQLDSFGVSRCIRPFHPACDPHGNCQTAPQIFFLSPLLHLYLPFISSGCCGPHRARSSWRSLEIFIVGERTRFLFNNDHSQHDERSMELLPSESPSSYTIYSSSALRCLQAYVHTTYALNTSSRNNSPQSNSHARAHRLS
jgi:hypothetical protein